MTTYTNTHACNAPAARRRSSPFALFALYRQRRALAALDAHRLHDLGLTRQEADAEAHRPIWDAPTTWSQKP